MEVCSSCIETPTLTSFIRSLPLLIFGFAVLFAVRAAVKALGLPLLVRLLQPLSSESSNDSEGDSDSDSDVHLHRTRTCSSASDELEYSSALAADKELNPLRRYTIELPLKIVTYGAVGFTTVLLMPVLATLKHSLGFDEAGFGI